MVGQRAPLHLAERHAPDGRDADTDADTREEKRLGHHRNTGTSRWLPGEIPSLAHV